MGWFVLAILFLLILLPLAAVILQVLLPGIFFGKLTVGDLSLLFEVFRRPLWLLSLKNSLLLGIGTTLFAALLGGALAMVRAKWSFPTARWLDVANWLLIITPSFILAQGWVMFASSGGIAAEWFGWGWFHSLVFNPLGLIAIMTLSKFPLAYLTVYAALEWKEKRLHDAARLNGGSAWAVLRTVDMPLLLPAYFSGALLIFMDTVGDFGMPASIAAVFRFPTLPYSIYTALYTSPIRFDMAGVLSFYLVLLIALAMGLQFYVLRKSRYDFLTARATRYEPQKPKRFAMLLTTGNLFFLAIVLGIPFGSNLLMSLSDSTTTSGIKGLTLQHYEQLFRNGGPLLESIQHSIGIASIAALVGVILGFLVAYVLTYSLFPYRQVIDVISLISFAVPGVVLGIGYIFIWNQAWLKSVGLLLYGTPWILVLAGIAGAIPITTRIMVGGMAKIPKTLLHAAQVQGAGGIQRMVSILFPLLRAAFLSSVLAAFGTTVFDLAITSILYPPNFITLPVSINKAFENLQFGYASAVTLTGGGLVILIILIVQLIFKENRFHGGRGME
ncbi:ABC transporter permease [Thermicanus aegyptius]|uniref:ABC transporter permease n=1 Tax=Thermicanus aegyptius TaxID=94009 RepID=UPI0004209655|nr:iron ABC transporter permease [Thermicanus aegyptius]